MVGEGTASSKRIVTLDVLKGALMIGIVLIHLFYLSDAHTSRPGSVSPVYIQMLYLGLMLFFISAGYFFRPDRGVVNNIKKRVVQLLIPILVGLIVLPTILFAYLTALGQAPTWDDLYPSYKAVLGGVHVFDTYTSAGIDIGMCFVYNGYYFLQLMVVAFIPFYILAEKVLDDPKKLFVAIFLLVTCTVLLREFVDMRLPFYAQLSPLAAAFMLLGAALGRKGLLERIEGASLKSGKLWAFFFISLAIGAVVVLIFPTGTGFDMTYFGEYGGYSAYPYFIAATFTCLALIVIGSLVARISVLSKVLATAGKHSIALICLHIFVIKLMMAPFHHLSSVNVFPAVSTAENIAYWAVSVAVIVLLAEYLPGIIKKRMDSKREKE